MKLKLICAIALLWSYAGAVLAGVPAPEIDGALSLQALGLLTGVVFLMKKKQ